MADRPSPASPTVRRLRQIAGLARNVSSSLELQAVLEQVALAVADVRPDVHCAIRLVDPVARGYRLVAWGGRPPMTHTPVRPFGEGITHVTAASREPVLVEDVLADPRVQDKAWFTGLGLGSTTACPSSSTITLPP